MGKLCLSSHCSTGLLPGNGKRKAAWHTFGRGWFAEGKDGGKQLSRRRVYCVIFALNEHVTKVLTDPEVPYRVIMRKSDVGAPPEQTLVENRHTCRSLWDEKAASDWSSWNKNIIQLLGFMTRMCRRHQRGVAGVWQEDA